MVEKKLVVVLIVLSLLSYVFLNLFYQKEEPKKQFEKNFWVAKYLKYDSEVGDMCFHTEWYDNTTEVHYDSRVLAWDESYVLESYIEMYRSTRNTTFLDKFVKHTDRIMNGLKDPDGDGYYGIGTYDSEVKVMNNDFEQPSKPTNPADPTPAYWKRYENADNTTVRRTKDCDGRWSLQVTTQPGTVQGAYQQIFGVGRNQSFKLLFIAKTNGKVCGKVCVADSTNKKIVQITFSTPFWEKYSAEFYAVNTTYLQVNLEVGSTAEECNKSGGAVWFDSVFVGGYSEGFGEEGLIMTPIAQYVYTVYSDPALWDVYKTSADRYLGVIETHIIPKWEIYWYNHTPSGGGYLSKKGYEKIPAYNGLCAYGRLLFAMYDISVLKGSPNKNYFEKATKLATYFYKVGLNRSFTNPHVGRFIELDSEGVAYWWYYAGVAGSVEDIAHANLDIAFCIDAYDHGVVFDRVDMDRFASTLLKVVWNKDLNNIKFSLCVDGSANSWYAHYLHKIYSPELPFERTVEQWAELARFDPAVNVLCQHIMADLPPFPPGMLTLAHIIKYL